MSYCLIVFVIVELRTTLPIRVVGLTLLSVISVWVSSFSSQRRLHAAACTAGRRAAQRFELVCFRLTKRDGEPHHRHERFLCRPLPRTLRLPRRFRATRLYQAAHHPMQLELAKLAPAPRYQTIDLCVPSRPWPRSQRPNWVLPPPHAVHIHSESQSPDCAYPKVLTGFVYIRSDS